MGTLQGKVAWVTGAGTGIGEAAALALAREGATVVLTGRRREPLEAVAARINGQGSKAVVRPCDVAKSAAVERIASREGRGVYQSAGRRFRPPVVQATRDVTAGRATRTSSDAAPRIVGRVIKGSLSQSQPKVPSGGSQQGVRTPARNLRRSREARS